MHTSRYGTCGGWSSAARPRIDRAPEPDAIRPSGTGAIFFVFACQVFHALPPCRLSSKTEREGKHEQENHSHARGGHGRRSNVCASGAGSQGRTWLQGRSASGPPPRSGPATPSSPSPLRTGNSGCGPGHRSDRERNRKSTAGSRRARACGCESGSRCGAADHGRHARSGLHDNHLCYAYGDTLQPLVGRIPQKTLKHNILCYR